MPNTCEIEFKFKGDHIDFDDFVRFFTNQETTHRIDRFSGYDDYFRNSSNVVIRHRWNSEKNISELAIKLRKSSTSITNRVEQEISLDRHLTSPDALKDFLDLMDFKQNLSLYKDATIAWLNYGDKEFTVSLYTVKDVNSKKKKTFFEVEIEKGHNLSELEAEILLKEFTSTIKSHFKLTRPLGLSLYEIFSGTKYNLI